MHDFIMHHYIVSHFILICKCTLYMTFIQIELIVCACLLTHWQGCLESKNTTYCQTISFNPSKIMRDPIGIELPH